MKIEEIKMLSQSVQQAIGWLETYQPNAVAISKLYEFRRELRKISYALERNCAVAAYGESQVGKSYLMSALLAPEYDELRVSDGKGGSYSFINELNPSGGSMAKEESTGVVTRFTTRCNPEAVKHLVGIQCLSIVDIILLLCDTYYKDVKGNPDCALSTAQINERIDAVMGQYNHARAVQSQLTHDDIFEIKDYMREVLGGKTGAVLSSQFFVSVPQIIESMPRQSWSHVLSLLWNANTHITSLLDKFLQAYERISFVEDIYVPFDAVLKDKGTILKISWLDLVSNENANLPDEYERFTPIYDKQGILLCADFDKAYLSALTAELSLIIPDQTINSKPFLAKLDLLDLPGARRRENTLEDNLHSEIGNLVRRGKVAYLFNKYSRTLRINSILFCQHQDQSGQSEMGEALDEWINHNIGKTPKDRAKFLSGNSGISPFFIVGTKFNMELKHTAERPGINLSDRWRTRFDKILSDEIIKPQTYSWFDKWITSPSGDFEPFRSIYLLRDFFWSRDQSIFRGYKPGVSGEIEEIIPEDYPNYRKDLRESFVNYPFVQKHFSNPSDTWDSVATLNNDGTIPIIRDLCAISTTLDGARFAKYSQDLRAIASFVIEALGQYYVPNGESEKRERLIQVINRTKLEMSLLLGNRPEALGRMVESFMLDPKRLQRIVYDILIRKTDLPEENSPINTIRLQADIKVSDSRQQAIEKLQGTFGSIDIVEEVCRKQGIDIEVVLAPSTQLATTIEDVLSNAIYKCWRENVQQKATELPEEITYRDAIGSMYLGMAERLNLRTHLHSTIAKYIQLHRNNEQVVINSLSDASAILLNNFTSSIGQDYVSPEMKSDVNNLAQSLGVIVPSDKQVEKVGLIETLEAFEASKRSIAIFAPTLELYRLPRWAAAHAWQSGLIQGLLLSSQISSCDHESNDALGRIIESIPR